MEEKPPLSKKERRELGRQRREGEKSARKLKRGFRTLVKTLVVVSVIGGVVYGFGKLASIPPGGLFVGSDWTQGGPRSAVTLVQYSDFQCPACARHHRFLKQLLEEFEDDMTFVYRHFPLRRTHPNAEGAARTAEAAGKQGKFWEMHNLLYENRSEWVGERDPTGIFEKYAAGLQLDPDQFKRDVKSRRVRLNVQDDYRSGVGLGVNSTPSYFLNGTRIRNPRSYAEFKALMIASVAQGRR